MDLLRLAEVLVVDVARPRRVNSNEVILALVLEEGVSDNIPVATIESSDLLKSGLLLLVSDPVFGVAASSLCLLTDDVVLGGRCGVGVILA